MDALQVELSQARYAGMSDAEAAAAVNARTVTIRVPVETWRVRQAAIEGGYWADLVLAREVTDKRGLAINVLAWIDDQSGTIRTVDMDKPAVVAMREALVEAEICTQAQADELAALGTVSMPWTASVGLPEIGIGLVRNARRSIGG